MATTTELKHVTASAASTRKPAETTLPETGWLAVADLLVDYTYQHKPYANAIDALNKDYEERYSGFILVNIRADGSMWIIDGQTRYAVHQLRQFPWIKAEILRGMTQAEEAEVYLFKCINAKRMPVDFFQAEYVARRPMAVLIHDILDKHGVEIESYGSSQRHRSVDTTPVVTCVSLLKRLLNRDPQGDVLNMTLDLIDDTWEYTGNSLTAVFLEAVHKLLVLHSAELDRRAFIAKLEGHRPEELREQALVLRMGTKLTVCAALQRVFVDYYNHGRPQDRRIDLGSPHRS